MTVAEKNSSKERLTSPNLGVQIRENSEIELAIPLDLAPALEFLLGGDSRFKAKVRSRLATWIRLTVRDALADFSAEGRSSRGTPTTCEI